MTGMMTQEAAQRVMSGVTQGVTKKMTRQKKEAVLLRSIVYALTALVGMAIALLCVFILGRGLIHLTPSLFAWHYTSANASLTPALINTIVMTAVSLSIAVPCGIGAAVYLTEYAKRGSTAVKVIRITTETLAAIPSIVYGLAGYMIFVVALKWQFSLLSGACTLAIMVLPVVMRTAEEALLAVDNSLREASFALGETRLRTIRLVVLPVASKAIASGVTLAAGRIVGESAALIYTAGTVARVPKSLMSSGRTLAVHLYALWCEGLKAESADATAAVLVLFVAAFNALGYAISRGRKEKNR